jgi:hypothetical protein
MHVEHVMISVPVVDALDLEELTSIQGTRTLESKPFDGVVVSQILVPITAVSVPLIKVWIAQRFDHKKAQSFTVRGMKFNAYSAKEIERLVQVLEKSSGGSSQPEAGRDED